MTESMLESLQDIFRFVLQLPDETDLYSVRQDNTPKWDSMAQVSLVAGIEGEFDVQLELAEAMQITSFESCVKLLEQKLT
ncbi:MAG: acyl carrier protein [Cellvibrio sp.]|jgi:acyl carrier protein